MITIQLDLCDSICSGAMCSVGLFVRSVGRSVRSFCRFFFCFLDAVHSVSLFHFITYIYLIFLNISHNLHVKIHEHSDMNDYLFWRILRTVSTWLLAPNDHTVLQYHEACNHLYSLLHMRRTSAGCIATLRRSLWDYIARQSEQVLAM